MQFLRTNYLNIEHLLLFIVFPISLTLDFSIYIKLTLGLIGVIYVVYVAYKKQYFKKQQHLSQSNKTLFWSQLAVKFSIIAFFTSIITLVFYKEELFNAIQNNPLKSLIISAVYVFLSVIPQEFIYRKFYFLRYQTIFKNDYQIIGVNSAVFCLGHLFFNNLLVVAITLVGGFIFSWSYNNFKSFRFICIEHSLYGLWLYIVGLGGLLGFPV